MQVVNLLMLSLTVQLLATHACVKPANVLSVQRHSLWSMSHGDWEIASVAHCS